MPMVVGRRVLGSFVKAICGGSGMTTAVNLDEDAEDREKYNWESLGAAAFGGDKGEEIRRETVEGVLSEGAIGGWCDEQTTILRHLLSHLLQKEEDWLAAAHALMRIPLEGGSRLISDEEKLSVYMKIVRLLLECDESGQAQTYFSRASLLIHTTKDKETLLTYRLSQARLFDFSARFNEAAQRYHELSFDSSIDEDDRLKMLQAAVTTSLLAPAGPQRSRILASLNRDDRIHTSLPAYLSTMLRKMLLEYILRAEEVKEFENGLSDHQRAKVEGGGTMLERAVREHNVGACGKVYDNIGFDGLGDLLSLDATAAEAMARRMIEQGRLRAWIDQPLHLLYFESRSTHDTDADAQGTAGGLGVERDEKGIEGVTWTERWDDRIRATSIKVESIAEAIQQKRAIAA
ncbi:COP9 signalosome complex subunit 4, partial [Tremellales sp. Uapishka_1]